MIGCVLICSLAIGSISVVGIDNISKENALMRMNAQLDEEFFRENSDYIIENNSDISSLNIQLEGLIKQLNR